MQLLTKLFKKYFIPHDENDFKPHFLRHESILFFFLAVIIIELSFLAQVFLVFNKTSFLAAVLPGALTTLTNEERAQNNAAPLQVNDLLTKAAELKANDMATKGYFAHTSPEGKTPWYWFDQVGYHYTEAGENLAINFFESNDVAQAWMNSPSHRENIVKKDYTEIGIGVATGMYQGKSTVFVAQLFGTPLQFPELASSAGASGTANTPPKSKTASIKPKIKIAKIPSTPIIIQSPIKTEVLGEETHSAPVVPNNFSTQIRSLTLEILTSPGEYVKYIFIGILILVAFSLLLYKFIRSEMAHPLILARGIGLIAVIIFLLFLNIKVFHLQTQVPKDNNDLAATVF